MAGHARSIYVECHIRGPIERVWHLTQTPDLHRQWDLRFTDIQYLPRPDTAQPQRFVYTTRIGLGMEVRGEGETVGNCDEPGGRRVSALKFWSNDKKSLIREGSGYWKYLPAGEDGQAVRFITGYDYDVRFGDLGRLFDRLVFRPLMGWATAWSFDRLRLWVEKGIDPAISMRRSVAYLTARIILAAVWIYQGVVPKLLFRHPDELAMLRDAGLTETAARMACIGAGLAELLLGVFIVLSWRSRWPLWLTLVAMPLATLGVALASPRFLTATFNPIALNTAVFGLAAIALAELRDLPSAGHCIRRPSEGDA
jgi:hypothetical protein